MRTLCLLIATTLLGLHAADWFTIDQPKTFEPGQPFVVTITVTDEDLAGKYVHADIHAMKFDGKWGGVVQSGGSKRITVNQAEEFRFTPSPKAGLKEIYVNVYSSEDNSWDSRIDNVAGPRIAIPGAEAPKKPELDLRIVYRRSWLKFGDISLKGGGKPEDGVYRSGMEIQVPVTYFLHEGDAYCPTELKLQAVGPWIDNPDGTYTKKRHHVPYPSMRNQVEAVVGEESSHTFTFTLPPSVNTRGDQGMKDDNLLWLLNFTNEWGDWPWHIRSGGPAFRSDTEAITIHNVAPGNLFTYEETPSIRVELRQGGSGALTWTAHDVDNQLVNEGTLELGEQKPGSMVDVELPIEAKGCFAIRVHFDGQSQWHTVARIPDLEAIIGDQATPFGANASFDEEALEVARRLGFSHARTWFKWANHEPFNDDFRGLDELKKRIERMNAHHIKPWLLVHSPPAWAIASPKAKQGHYAVFDFRDEDLHDFVSTVSTELGDGIMGWEWLNEIVPGSNVDDPVETYLRFCKVAQNASKAVNPDYQNQMAGGLWPRSYRQELLKAGIAEYIDILPIHYGSGPGIEEARADVASVGAEHIRITDNETHRGASTWNMPLDVAMTITNQSKWALTRWPDELLAGCEMITVFAFANGDAAGNWQYLWQGRKPRPSAPTIALVVAKTFEAKPVGLFSLGEAGVFRLFEDRHGKGLLFANTIRKEGETVALFTGSDEIMITDYQGNDATVSTAGKTAELELADMPQIVELADIDAVKAYVVPSIRAGGEPKPGQRTVLTAYQGLDNEVTIQLDNVYDSATTGTFTIVNEAGDAVIGDQRFELAAGDTSVTSYPLPTDSLAQGLHTLTMITTLARDNTPVVEQPFTLNLVDTAMLGNLLENGGFEASATDPAPWSTADNAGVKASDGLAPGLGQHNWVFEAGKQYRTINQWKELQGVDQLLVSTWIRSEDMKCGANFGRLDPEGKYSQMTWMHVFNTPETQEHWQLYTTKVPVRPNDAKVSLLPIISGDGEGRFDNIRMTVYEGTDFAAEAHEVDTAPTIDGDLSDWDQRCPIPLIGRNQLTAQDGYDWNPHNCSGVMFLRWDADNLYLAAEVWDDVHHAKDPSDGVVNHDSLSILIHPGNRQPGTEAKASSVTMSECKPGGGSGRYTLYRLAERAGGLKVGHIARDSSLHDLVVIRDGTRTIYELRYALSDSNGVAGAIGTKIGFAAVLADNDGQGLGGQLSWGGGLIPDWLPNTAGVVTFVE